jgi:isopentenyl-diphosphate delta-isomerase
MGPAAAVAPPIPAWVDGVLRPCDKIDVHRRGLRHPAVSVFAFSGPRLLIQQRATGKYHTPGLWANSCCTHPMWGEEPSDCARRRMQQELGLKIGPPIPLGRVEYRAAVGSGMVEHEVVDIFRAELPEAAEPRPDPAEVAATRWVDAQALLREIAAEPERFTPWLKIYLADHSDLIFDGPRKPGG